MSDFEDLLAEMLKIRRELAEHKILTANMLRVGPVVARDHKDGVRVEHGTDDASDRSAWVQPAERSGVERDLPRLGEQLMVLAPYGDSEQGITVPYGHTDKGQNPAGDADEVVLFNRDGFKVSLKDKVATFVIGKSTFKMAENGVTIDVDGKSYELTGAGHKLKGGKVTHDDLNIGGTHTHSGVLPGSAKTAGPDA